MAISAVGELTFDKTVTHSMELIQMPVYLLYLLGVLKILGIIALWFSPYKWLKEWAGVHYTMVQGWKTFYDPTGDLYNKKLRASIFVNFGSY